MGGKERSKVDIMAVGLDIIVEQVLAGYASSSQAVRE